MGLLSGYRCDECRVVCMMEHHTYTMNKGDTLRSMRAKGWSYGKRTLCPECRDRIKTKGAKHE